MQAGGAEPIAIGTTHFQEADTRRRTAGTERSVLWYVTLWRKVRNEVDALENALFSNCGWPA